MFRDSLQLPFAKVRTRPDPGRRAKTLVLAADVEQQSVPTRELGRDLTLERQAEMGVEDIGTATLPKDPAGRTRWFAIPELAASFVSGVADQSKCLRLFQYEGTLRFSIVQKQ
jgi:hypothetical protein